MGEDANVPTCSTSQPEALVVHQQSMPGTFTVIVDSADIKFIPVDIAEGEEVVMYEDVQEDIKVEEIDVYSDGYQEVYTQQVVTPKESKPRSSRRGAHQCKVCSKTFSQMVNLITHERIHTGEKPYKCTVCMKPFSQQPNLWKHMRTHTGERPYQCTICSKSFTQQANLTKHIRIHTGERPYACQYCNKRFTQQANLTKHIRLHTGERPYSCHYCVKSFVQQSNLERHVRTHTGAKPFKCDFCLDSFTQNAHLTKHIRCIHKIVVKPLNVKTSNQCVTTEAEDPNQIDSEKYQSLIKRVGIPVLLCTKTGKIIKRVD